MTDDSRAARQSATSRPAIFDGHNDLLLRLWRADAAARDRLWLEGDGERPPRPAAHAAGRLRRRALRDLRPLAARRRRRCDAAMDAPPYDLPLPEPIAAAEAQPVALAMAGILLRMERVVGAARLRSAARPPRSARCLAAAASRR